MTHTHWGLGSAEQEVWDKQGTGPGGNTCPSCAQARYEANPSCNQPSHRQVTFEDRICRHGCGVVGAEAIRRDAASAERERIVEWMREWDHYRTRPP